MPGIDTGKFNGIIKKGQNMKLVKFKIKNFRGYSDEVSICFDNLTAFVGKNDVGKSTILEAMDIFFNSGKGVVKLDKDDINKTCSGKGNTEIVFSACFSELPDTVTIDETHSTKLAEEYLLNSEGNLEIVKKYKDAGAEKVFIKANHPTNSNCSDLLSKKNAELKKILDNKGITCGNRTTNSIMRKAIWTHYESDLQLTDIELDVSTKGEVDGIKSIWEKLQNFIPIYSLFQSDRKNSDTDDEVQNPLQTAVKQILSNGEVQTKLNEISKIVLDELANIANGTLEKLNSINPSLASTLSPQIPDTNSLKWPDVFKKVSIASNNDIPVNKRGSGVKRLILLSFFQVEAEKKKTENNNRGIIYAIEEPETSQHYEHQRILINSLKTLSNAQNTQIVITTHSSTIVKELGFNNIRLIQDTTANKEVRTIVRNYLPSPSLNEVNYLSFEEISLEYHDELYGYLQTKAIEENSNNSVKVEFDTWLKNKMDNYPLKQWTKIKKDQSTEAYHYTLSSYIRNRVHHPENTNNSVETIEEIKQSIEAMQQVIISLV